MKGPADALGGVLHTILFDNMKTVLIHRDTYGPCEHRFNEGFRDFANHHGFGLRVWLRIGHGPKARSVGSTAISRKALSGRSRAG